LPTLTDAGSLGKTYAAFDSSGGGPLKENMELRITLDRLDNRRLLLQQIDGARRQADSSTSFARLDKYQQQAFEMIARGISDAFDISQEDPRTLARYDSRHTFRAADLQRYGDMRRTTNLLGHQLLLARRLCEAGCGFVTVSDCGWDMHANGNSPKGMTGMWPMSRQVDHAVAAFLDDLRERGMSDEILLVVTGEMGRTPRINKNGGRDHWGDLTALLLAGGGVPGGRVVGQSDAQAARPASDPYNPTHLAATIYQSLFEVGRMRLDASLPREVTQIVTGGKPILQA
jgi:hypothetical protein